MAKTSIDQFDTTAANNTDVNAVSCAVGWPAINIGNVVRNLMKLLKQYLANSVSAASASTVDLGAQTGNYITITGTTTITAFGTVAAGTWKQLKFSGALTLTYNATSLILPGAANITTAAGDTAEFVSEGSGNWRCLSYTRAANVPFTTINQNSVCGGRLTGTTLGPVPAGEGSTITTIYWTPYVSNQIAVYNGSSWVVQTFSEMSWAVPASTNTNYDLFYDYNSGTPQISGTAWTNATTRATALTTQDGIYVLSGTPTKRYLGTVRTNGTSGNVSDNAAQRFIWNYYNRVQRRLNITDATATWTYSTAAFQQARASSANMVAMVRGFDEDNVILQSFHAWENNAANVRICYTGIGLGSTANIATATTPSCNYQLGVPINQAYAYYSGMPGAGYRELWWLEKGAGADTQTWQGTTGDIKTGLVGEVAC